jgi:SAM-dependent methyltransferase
MLNDPWLNRWIPLIRERAGSGLVMEIGCGHGADTVTLVNEGISVFAFDLSLAAVAVAKLRAPSANIERRDIREPFPKQLTGLGVVIASLSLHYFSWAETKTLVERIRSTLRPSGVLLCRLNSTLDHNFGATGHPEIEPNYFLVDGEPKRFFDKTAIEVLFSEKWGTLAQEHFITDKYFKPKALWEVVVERREI